ncbi:hypothetical protein AgCh_008559 [Apium graveolens]
MMEYSKATLNDLYAKLMIEDEEEGGVIIGNSENEQRKDSFVLIGRFLTEKNINFNAMQNMLESLWRPKEGVEIHDIGHSDRDCNVVYANSGKEMERAYKNGYEHRSRRGMNIHGKNLEERRDGCKSIWIGASGTTGSLSENEKVNRVTEEQNMQLVAPISAEEIKVVAFSMHAEKAPGYDGLNPGFYQSYWSVVEKDVVLFCQKFFDTGELQMKVNRTVVCLIPKVKKPTKMTESNLRGEFGKEIQYPLTYILFVPRGSAQLLKDTKRAVKTEARVMKRIIRRYEGLSGQAVNFAKSAITFSPNTSTEIRQKVCGILEVPESMAPGRNLGESSIPDANFWKKLWNLEMPGKVHFFLWRNLISELKASEDIYQDLSAGRLQIRNAADLQEKIWTKTKEDMHEELED